VPGYGSKAGRYNPRMTYQERLQALLSPTERTVLARLSTPQKVQDYLDSLPINFEAKGETYMSPRRVLREGVAHCLEGALLAAAAFAYHGQPPLLMDFQTVPSDEDHVIAIFKQNGFWGAISKTNHSVLRYRDPIYRSPRELAASYFHEYFEWNGKKSLRNYSAPFDMRRYKNIAKWLTAEDEMHWLADAINDSRHFPLVPKKNLKLLRPVAKVEIKAMRSVTEWKKK